ncbi:hypothetical protein TPL01_15710 [Sulfuriferula plumbiphila]|uniref:Lipoprotein n=1 Tax=Sulfuriferula plumbiphila TaxID=171865 RepID=A0A512L7G9_9PROT|nr:hypothetical protein [Sulfuriferula plumbiphila]BBP04050.1 hypothetical protein SFPGR_14720 [Sulfuriferula plumbiphila]GEP30433.1 hypothetical protein TPL01_15710 [Sulfuriferula plumbiphila]
MIRALAVAIFIFPATVSAAPWQFDQPIDVTPVHGAKVFHHVEAAGRKSIAVSGASVAVVWEDNRDGVSRCYVAVKRSAESGFEADRPVSGGKEAFEPSIVSLHDGRFAVAWEQDGGVWSRVVSATQMGLPLKLAGPGSSAASAGFSPRAGLWIAWSQQDGHYAGIHAEKLGYAPAADRLAPGMAVSVDGAPLSGDQLYPSVAALQTGGVVIAWEDRRRGHTTIMYSHAGTGGKFVAATQMNETRRDARNAAVGPGTGAMRVALAAEAGNSVAAVWSDKRDFLSGYDVYAAFSSDGGAHFGANQMVQDGFGDNTPQWHPAIASDRRGKLAVVWDDNRDGSPDIWLAWPTASGWSDNVNVPGAAGAGVQSDPSIAMDSQGNLHLVWLEKQAADGPTRLRYEMGRAVADRLNTQK